MYHQRRVINLEATVPRLRFSCLPLIHNPQNVIIPLKISCAPKICAENELCWCGITFIRWGYLGETNNQFLKNFIRESL